MLLYTCISPTRISEEHTRGKRGCQWLGSMDMKDGCRGSSRRIFRVLITV